MVPVFAFLQPMAAGFTSLRHAGFHRWFHLWQLAPTIGHTSTEQLSGANDGTGSARRSAHHQERTCHARKEGRRSAILRLPRRDENAQRLCSPLAPRRAIWCAGVHALVPVTGAQTPMCSVVSRLSDYASFHPGQQDPFTWLHGSDGPRWPTGA